MTPRISGQMLWDCSILAMPIEGNKSFACCSCQRAIEAESTVSPARQKPEIACLPVFDAIPKKRHPQKQKRYQKRNKEAKKQRNKETIEARDRNKHRHTHTQNHTNTGTQKQRNTHTKDQANKQTYNQANTHTHTHTDTNKQRKHKQTSGSCSSWIPKSSSETNLEQPVSRSII